VATVTTTHDLDLSDPDDRRRWDELRRPRDDVVIERQVDEDRFACATGPFSDYERTLSADRHGDRLRVTERTDFTLAIPGWGVVFRRPIKGRLARRAEGRPWWAPPDVFDADMSTTLAALAAMTLVAGYLGTLITQTITFAADDFGASDQAQGATLAVVRVGVLLALALTALADRRGRHDLIRWAAVGGCVTAAVGALAPNLVWLGASQTVSRGFSTALAVLIGIVAAETVPRNSRAYAISLLALSAALGSGMAVWALPLADLGEGGWRLVYLIPLIGIPFSLAVTRGLPESARYVRAHERAPARARPARLWLLASGAFLSLLFLAPASQFLNDFLRDERGFSAARISAFTLLTNTPGIIGIVVGGRLADARGRRMVGAVALTGGVALTVVTYVTAGWPMWVWSVAATIVGAATVPALGVYGPELFPTSARGRANGLITLIGVVGSAAGLLAVGTLSDSIGSLGPAMALVAVGPALLAVLILTRYPETAHLELEEINPEDADPASQGPP
jgi:predicted MFS family arabinose efflux permease